MRQMKMYLVGLICLLAVDAAAGERIGAILRDDGKLVTIYGPAGNPTLEAMPAATHYVFYAQADGLSAWAATTADSLIYSSKTAYRAALPAKPRALSIAPNGTFTGVVVGNSVGIYWVDSFGQLNPVKRLDIPKGIAGPPEATITLTLIDSANFCLGVGDKTYFVGMDNIFTPSPKHLSIVRALGRGYLGYVPSEQAVVIARYNGYNNRATFEGLGGGADSIKEPTSAAHSAGGRVWLSQRGEQNLASVDLSTREVRTYAMRAEGTLAPTMLPGIFVWTPDTLLDTTAAREPKLVRLQTAK